MSVNSLGNFRFVAFHNPGDPGAPPILPAQAGESIQRPGVDGTTILRLGVKAEPFQMRSGVDVPSVGDAASLLAQYIASQNVEPLSIVWGSIDYFVAFGALYVPLRVEPIRIRRISAPVGGLYGALGGAWLEALWTLQPIYAAAFV